MVAVIFTQLCYKQEKQSEERTENKERIKISLLQLLCALFNLNDDFTL